MANIRKRVLIIPAIFAIVVYGTMFAYYTYMTHKNAKIDAELFAEYEKLPPINTEIKDGVVVVSPR